jgi:sulfur carrier protein ThiS
MSIDVMVFGSLGAMVRSGGSGPVRVDLDRPQSLADLLDRLGIPLDRVQLVMVNHRAVPPDHSVAPGDRVAIFPGEYKVFWDWYGFRNPKHPRSAAKPAV